MNVQSRNSAAPEGGLVGSSRSAEHCEPAPSGQRVGQVTRVMGERVEVLIGIGSCDGCGHSNTCSLLMQGRTTEVVEAVGDGTMGVGDLVRVDFSAESRVKSACLLYLCPSISTLLGGVLGAEWLSGLVGLAPSLAGLLLALVLLPLGLLPGYLVNRRGANVPKAVKIRKEE